MGSLAITAGLKLSLPGKLHPVKTSIAPVKSLIKKLTPILALDKSLTDKQSAELRSANSHLKCGIGKANQIKLHKIMEPTVKPFIEGTITNRTLWGKPIKNSFPNFGECHRPDTGQSKIAYPHYGYKNTRLTFQPSTLNQFVSWSILTLAPLEIKAKGSRLKRHPVQLPPMVDVERGVRHWLIPLPQIEEKAKGLHFKCDPVQLLRCEEFNNRKLRVGLLQRLNLRSCTFTQFSVKNSSSIQFPQIVEIKQNQQYPFLDSVLGGAS